MSQLNVNAIYDASGGDSVDVFSENAAKAWARVTGTGTAAINASFGIESLSDDGTGDYTLTFTTAFTSSNYGLSSMQLATGLEYINQVEAWAAGTVNVRTINTNGTAAKADSSFWISAFGDQ